MEPCGFFVVVVVFVLFFFFISMQLLVLPSPSALSVGHRRLLQDGTVSSCPLDFDAIRPLVQGSKRSTLDCQYIRQVLRLVQSEYLRRTGSFLPPLNKAESCWESYETLVHEFDPNFDIRRTCGFQTSWISQGCMNITTRAEFEGNVPWFTLVNIVSACNQSLENGSPCASCTTSLSSLQASYLTGPSVGNVSDCTAYPSIYAAAFSNQFGPTDQGTAMCLFSLDFTSSSSKDTQKKIVISVVALVCGVILFLGVFGFWYLWRKRRIMRKKRNIVINHSNLDFGLESISGSTTLVRFTFEEIKQATKNFSRGNMIGRGGYGNVYRGVLPDGSEVAFKRFKNCSAGSDATFTHEVEVIASIRHVNLLALRGYCTAITSLEGHQRIIVCDLMKNGSLHDHLFGLVEKKLSWPIRQKIALGTARGLAYLHYGAQPAIMHRDIKASNILLERSDVYSFGVVLLELLSGKKALLVANEGQPALVTDWAWSLVRQGRTLDVIEDGMPDLGPPEVMEKYVLVAVLCSHPQLYARPTIDQVVKILDTGIPVPTIPERPIPLIADIDDIERSVSSSGSGDLSARMTTLSYLRKKRRIQVADRSCSICKVSH
ncbi:unnamed protein product [Ilex paraguariensis]|uniref:Protein kinase domain-containing protein n=1 Tax=Ilex paraguariensis TaxID=185542 RepID=A0ABC8S195_9AQUA